ncbi:MAG: phosphatidylserine/phosphatidylglycerophosphate/cardiolipin synthase family protein [Verrucomicrobiota bacterium]
MKTVSPKQCCSVKHLWLVASAALMVMQGACTSKAKKAKAEDEEASKPSTGTIVKGISRSTVGATAMAPVGATRIGTVVMYDRLRTFLFGNAPLAEGITKVDGQLLAGAGGEAFERLLDREKLPARTSGSVKFMIDGDAFYPVYLKAIREARSSVDVQTFIFDTDDVAVSVADALKAKSQEIPVRVYYDGNGSADAGDKKPKTLPSGFSPVKSIQDHLTKDSKIQVRRTANAYMVTDHSKLHVIDGHTVFIGGMNIGREYRHEWHDMMSRVQGPVVEPLRQIYEQGWSGDAWWRKLDGGRAAPAPVPAPPDASAEPLAELRILRTHTRGGRREVLKTALLAFRCASKRIWLQTPYYSCDEVTEELKAAVKRGVDVRVIVPADCDYDIMEANNAADLKKLLDIGAKAYLYPGMTHLKATVCDNWAMYGSANYDTLSLRVNVELNLASSDPRIVRTLAHDVFERDFRVSKRLTPAMAEARMKDKGNAITEVTADQL